MSKSSEIVLYRTCKRMIQRGTIDGLAEKMRGVCGSPQECSVSAWFYTSSSCTLRHARANSTAPSARVKASSTQLKGRVP